MGKAPKGIYFDQGRRRWIVQLRVTLPGGRALRHWTSHPTEEEARRVLQEVQEDLLLVRADDKRNRRLGRPAATSAPSFADYSERWLTTRRGANLRPATLREYEVVLRTHLVPRFGVRNLVAIERPDVQRMADEIAGAGHAPGGVRAIVAVLSSCLGRAVREGLLAANPCLGVELPKVRLTDRLAHRRPLSPSELEGLLAATTQEHWRVLYRVAAGTGLRLSELGRLRWADVDLAGEVAVLRVHKAKSGRPRIVPVLPDAVTALNAWPKSLGGRVFGFLELGDDGNVTAVARSVVKNALARAARRAGLGKVRFHDLRHTWATAAGLAGVPSEALRAAGGWSSLSLVTHYGRATDDAALAAWRGVLRPGGRE